MRRGDAVTYGLNNAITVDAIVERVHRDRTVTVKARHYVVHGERVGAYLGFRYRVPASTFAGQAEAERGRA